VKEHSPEKLVEEEHHDKKSHSDKDSKSPHEDAE